MHQWSRVCELCVLLSVLSAGCQGLNMLRYDETRRAVSLDHITVSPKTGDVFVAGRNVLYRFDALLHEQEQLATGPRLDGLDCSPLPDAPCPSHSLVDNEATVLEIYPDANYLLFCGTVKQGLCTLYSLSNFHKFQALEAENIVNYMGSRAGSYAFFGRGHALGEDNVTTLYVGSTYDGRPRQYFSSAVSARRLISSPSGKYNVSYLHEDPRRCIFSSMDYDPDYQASYIVHYIYGFEFQGFSYFLTVQREGVHMDDYITRLIRVCQKDPAFYSYTEITLNCRKHDYTSVFFNVAQAGYLGPVGRELATKFGWSHDETVLYVAFAHSPDGSYTTDTRFGTGVCMYTMTEIKQHFTRAQKDCYMGYGSVLSWINKEVPKCRFDSHIAMGITNNEDFCGDSINVGIGGRYPLMATANITSDIHIATSIGVIEYHGKTIVVLGTQAGYVIKVLVDGDASTKPYAIINVAEGASSTAVSRDIAFDSQMQHMYTLTGKRSVQYEVDPCEHPYLWDEEENTGPEVTRVPIQSCKVYKKCSECVTTVDPLQCGWCGNHCTTKGECLTATWKEDSCPPVIYAFEPTSGPVEGGTRVTITGHNFGTNDPKSESVQVSVQVALVDCVIEHRNSSNVICRTGKSERVTDRQINVVVVDRSKQTVNYTIEGSDSTDHESFFYKKAAMNSFKPVMGPKSGGTSLTIQGENLDIGSSLSIDTGHLPCTPISVKASHIICNTTRYEPELNYRYRHQRSLSAVVPVNVTIDAASLFVASMHFRFEEDPEIEDVSPRVSVLSGGLHITISGKNLHVIQEPKIVGTVVGDNTVSSPAPCQADLTGETMVCNSPNINTTKLSVNEASPLGVDVHFLMDGVEALRYFPNTHPILSRFTYVMDPIVYKFPGPNNLRTFYEDETHLDIKGAFLNQIDLKSDIVVTVGDGFCNVTLIGTTVLLCSPDRPEVFQDDEQSRKVEVTVGNLRFDVGDLQFSKREPNIVVAALMITGLAVLAVIVLIFICLWLKKTHKGPFKKKMIGQDTPDVRYTRGEMVTLGPRSEQQLYRIPTTENPYASNTQGRLRHRTPIQIPRRPGDSMILDEEARHLIEDANLLIDRDKILLLEVIGQGHFGCVYRGFMKCEGQKEEIEVAVKTLKSLTEHFMIRGIRYHNMYTSSHEGRKFLEEALRMRDFDHPNIVRLIGIALDKEDMPLVVLPFMQHGDLLTYIRDEANSPTVKDLMDFGIEISQGMEYLSSLKFVHRDLAARNCMLDDNMTVKVADFGLSRDIYERDYYSSDDRKAKLPVKWMALESLEKGIYNIKTDVWSFGVVLWELMTRGVCPYPEVDNWDIIKYLKSGRRMPQPSYCPDQLYSIMLQCWDEHARLRPSFAELVKAIKSIIDHMERAHQRVGLNVTYINVPTTQTYLYPQNPNQTGSGATLYRVMASSPTGIPAISNVLYAPECTTTASGLYGPQTELESEGAVGLASGYSSGYDTGSSGMYRTLPDRTHGYQGEPFHSTLDPLLQLSTPHYAHPRGSKGTLV